MKKAKGKVATNKAAEELMGHTGHVNGGLNLIKSNEKLLKQFKQR